MHEFMRYRIKASPTVFLRAIPALALSCATNSEKSLLIESTNQSASVSKTNMVYIYKEKSTSLRQVSPYLPDLFLPPSTPFPFNFFSYLRFKLGKLALVN